MINLLAAVVQVIESPDGDRVIIDPMGPMLMSAVFLFLALLPILVILFFFFYRKKLQHQQILAAMDKGLPIQDFLAVPEKKETGWIPNISAGIGLIVFAILLLIVYYPAGIYRIFDRPLVGFMAIPLVFACVGLSRLLRGIFQRAAKKKEDAEKPVKLSPAASQP